MKMEEKKRGENVKTRKNAMRFNECRFSPTHSISSIHYTTLAKAIKYYDALKKIMNEKEKCFICFEVHVQ